VLQFRAHNARNVPAYVVTSGPKPDHFAAVAVEIGLKRKRLSRKKCVSPREADLIAVISPVAPAMKEQRAVSDRRSMS